MSWNYRIMKREIYSGEFEYSIHEVYYNDEGNVISTSSPLIPSCPSPEAILEEFEIMKIAFEKEILIYHQED
ncbi:MAG: hypothetical protein K0S23_3307 [Fluviicola sp.]|jgi:hypothetical protein|nr:hypothetical protein [Fluviicola sp.]